MERLKATIQEEDDKLFTKLGNLTSGSECAHKFQENSLAKLIELIRKIDISICELEGVLKNRKQMFPKEITHQRNQEERKTRQSQNRES